MPTVEVLKIAKWYSSHFTFKVSWQHQHTRSCTPPFMGHILTKKTSPIRYLQTKNKVRPTLQHIFHEKFNSTEHLLCGTFLLLILQSHPTLKITIEWPQNLTTYRNQIFGLSPQTMPDNNNDNKVLVTRQLRPVSNVMLLRAELN